ncbi:family 81 glycoside hydrolase [Phakopsora pachyrhizi]|uniref:glucan endo-1,3-beta-D-glucosidase n=1 Tax=Phakopsora pachyrhizi TaxID=170000 RepID=A0AAV0AVL8_PHAPC|nr:family 81 glycoside hydrolase [Phakopsora pachyrhizi]CAH7672945.1 family 81 glycoside hydrolase [Phakopsora pachyrhizi]
MGSPQFVGPLFTPVDQTNPYRPPPALFGPWVRHPKPPINIEIDTVEGRSKPIGTNKWYTQLVLSPSGTDPVYVLPYALAFLNGSSVLSQHEGASSLVGMGISHSAPSSRIFGPTTGGEANGNSKFYYNPLAISFCLGAAEFNQSNVACSLSHWSELTARLKIFSRESSSSSSDISILICRGQAFLTCIYTGLSPTIRSACEVLSLECLNEGSEQFLHGFRKHRIKLGDRSTWLLYSKPVLPRTSFHIELKVIDRNQISHHHGPWSGIVQVVKMSEYYADQLGSDFHRFREESVYDRGVGVWVREATIRSGPIDSGTYYFDWFSEGPRARSEPPLIFALPHHIEAMQSHSGVLINPQIRLNSRATGDMRLCRGSTWCFKEDLQAVKLYGIEPVNVNNLNPKYDPSKLNLLGEVFIKEVDCDFDRECDLDSYYFSGKKLAKQALLCVIASSILRDEDLTLVCVSKTKESLLRFCQNRQKAPRLVYETTWKGIISSSMLVSGNENDDFGNGLYNDHHFHFAYFIHAASTLVYFDSGFLEEIREYIEYLIKDTNNAFEKDEFFPLFRNFDWFLGHSLATGLQTSLDGKNQESCSEDANFLYSLKLWGKATSNQALESLAELQLSILKRSANHYYYMKDSNTTIPAEFRRNRVPGILFENKADYTTFFSNEKDAIHMIQVIPVTPITPFLRDPEFVWQEWIDSGFKADRAGQVCNLATNLTNGYRTLLLCQYATIDPEFVWNFFEERISKGQQIPLDDGLSLSWALGFTLNQLG